MGWWEVQGSLIAAVFDTRLSYSIHDETSIMYQQDEMHTYTIPGRDVVSPL